LSKQQVNAVGSRQWIKKKGTRKKREGNEISRIKVPSVSLRKMDPVEKDTMVQVLELRNGETSERNKRPETPREESTNGGDEVRDSRKRAVGEGSPKDACGLRGKLQVKRSREVKRGCETLSLNQIFTRG